jgi:hypothetical protein
MSSTDRELLARALEAEAGNQGLPGMMAAGSVIMNRTRTPGYGGNLRGVILKPGQFSAFNSVTGYAGGAQGQDIENIRVSDTAYQAADALLSGKYEDPTGGATHFYNPKISNPSWGDDGSGNWTKIGAHVFGKADAGKSGQDIEVTELPSIPEEKRAGAIQFEEVDPTLRQRNAAIQGEAVNSFVPNANANNVGPRQNMQAQTGLLAGNSPQNMMGAGQAMQAEEPSKGFFDNDKYKNMAAVLAQGFAAMGKNPALQKFASQVAGQRTEAQARNKTIEFLRKSGRDDLADAVESGSLGARDAATELLKKPAATKGVVMGDRLVNPMTGEVMADLSGGYDAEAVGKARKEFTSQAFVKDFSNQTAAYARVMSSVEDPSPSGDLALIFNFMKVLDPGSTVREGEFATAAQAGKVDDRVLNMYNRVLAGETLTAAQRADFANRATMLYAGADRQYKSLADQYSAFAKAAGLPPDQVIPDFSYSGQLYSIPLEFQRPPAPEGTPEDEWSAAWKNMTDEQRREFMVEY